jgi:chemotaxis protein MotB
MNRMTIVGAALAALSLASCVSKGTYDESVRSAEQARADLAKETREAAGEVARLRAHVAELEGGRASMQKELDDAAFVDARLAQEIDKLGGDSRILRADNGKLSDALEASHRRLSELERAHAAAEQRAALYRDLAVKLQSMVDAGDLAISLRDGRMVLRMSNDVLFDSGHAELKPNGKRALSELADVLRTLSNRRFQVAGHTDNEPIRRSAFKTNWELSAARALEVVSFLVSKGIDARDLSAAGYGEFDPVETNETRDGRARNRRTEITLQPNIDEMVTLPGATEGGAP